MSELDSSGKSLSKTSTYIRNDWFGDFSLTNTLCNLEFVPTSYFSEEYDHLDVRLLLVSEDDVREIRSEVSVSSECDSGMDPISHL